MEPSLGLLSCGGGGGGGGGGGTGLSAEQTPVAEKDFMGMSKEAALELGLGLSLGNGGGGGGATAEKGKGSAWGEYGRILTAKDFPNGFSSGRAAGTKRERTAADTVEDGSASAAVSQVVGWPPIRSYRMNTLFNQAKTSSNVAGEKGVGGNENDENSKKKTNHGNEKADGIATPVPEFKGSVGFVKVNMDGLPIGRKVDLNAHKNYETLAKTLEEMFFMSSKSTRGGKDQPMETPKLLDGSSEFVLTYEDKEGDWMLVGDVPWRMFINTVKRLRIMRTSEANGLAPKFQERNEKQKGKPI